MKYMLLSLCSGGICAVNALAILLNIPTDPVAVLWTALAGWFIIFIYTNIKLAKALTGKEEK